MSTAVPPAPGASASGQENNSDSRTSIAIQRGADLLLELFNEEKSQLALVYRENLEKLFRQFKAQAEAQTASANSLLIKRTDLLENLYIQYDRSVQDLEVTRNELQQVRSEYAKLVASIEDAGLVYMNDETLHFNDTIAKIVSDFQESARMQDGIAISHLNSTLDTTLLHPDNNTESAIKPSDFFAFLSGVMEKGQWYAHGFKIHQQCQSASFSKGNTSTNDAALQDSEFEQDSLLM